MSNKVDKTKYEGMESLVTAVIVCDKNLIINYILIPVPRRSLR